jgi:N-acetylglucosaminyldiphosphoundecaprenol N-acetyl-beta-D-mannosaminyltransferase
VAPPTRQILGVDIALTDYAGELAAIDELIAGGGRGYFCHAAVASVMNAQRDPDVRRALNAATMTVPDGKPLVWALRSLGEEIDERVYGPDLMLAACERSLETGASHFLYGGHDEAATQELADSLSGRFTDLSIAGSWTPPFRELTDDERREVVGRINESGADIVWVGIGSPRQELWMERMRPLLRAPVLVGVGAAFDFHAGRVSQAPRWMGDHGLEWLYRLSREPRRLGPRYLRDNPAFVAAFARQWARERRGTTA